MYSHIKTRIAIRAIYNNKNMKGNLERKEKINVAIMPF